MLIKFSDVSPPDEPSTFAAAGPEQTLTFPSSGDVTVSGGVLLGDETNLPADENVVYATADPSIGADPSLSDALTISFPNPETNVSLNIFNGETVATSYQVTDNDGFSTTVTIAPNSDGGTALVGIPGGGSAVTITPVSGSGWDYSIDNISFGYNAAPTPIAKNPADLSFSAAENVIGFSLSLGLFDYSLLGGPAAALPVALLGAFAEGLAAVQAYQAV